MARGSCSCLSRFNDGPAARRKEIRIMNSLTTFLIVAILALAITPAPQSQKKSPPGAEAECGTLVTPEQLTAELARKAEPARKNSAPQAVAPTDNPYYLPMTIHMVCSSTGIGGLSSEQLEAVMQNLNQMWRSVGIQFFIYGEIDYSIQDDAFYILPNVSATQDALRRVNSVPNTINVYFTNLEGISGQARFTSDSAQGVLLDYGVMSGFSSGFFDLEVFAHEMGHYFDLYHTHETVFGVECPSGINCSTAGDRLCDTPADPKLFQPIRVDNNCAYDNSAALPGGCGNTPYQPLTNNLMSVAKKPCRNQFTPYQISKVLSVLRSASNRKNLINSVARYVDRLASDSNTNCTYEAPCRRLDQALQITSDGDFIFLKWGPYAASSIGGKRVALNKWGFEPGVGVVLVP